MKVSYKTLKAMLEDAFDAGAVSTCELKDQIFEEIVSNHKVAKPQDLTVYSVEELRRFPSGTKFCHSLLGTGEIVTKKGVRAPFMKFESGVTHAFAQDAFPWDMPMVQV